MDYKEKIIALLNSQELSKEQKEMLETIFPELAESEDERIRKAIHIYLDWLDGRRDYQPKGDYTIKDMIAWLEKQGENEANKMPIWKHWKDGICGNGEGKPIYLIKDGDAYSISTVLGYECDYIELSELDKLISVKDIEKIVGKIGPKFRVKYAGSEYNVLEIKDIAGVAFYGIEDEPNHIDYVKAENCEIIDDYAIKENGSPYPTKPAVFSEKKPQRMISAEAKEAMYAKPAWSEEDEVKINRIVDCLENLNVADNDILLKDVDWLKSLRPQNRWKPTKQQLSELRCVISGCSFETSVLVELEKNLKKLL